MTDWTDQTVRAQQWFEELRNRICAEFEAIEREAGSDAAFEFKPWQREEDGIGLYYYDARWYDPVLGVGTA